jgi:Na+-driven multidrug efflux pump
MAANAGGSFVHWTLAYVLAVSYQMNIQGVAIASAVHFVVRFLIMYILILKDQNASKCLIPMMHEDSFKGLK